MRRRASRSVAKGAGAPVLMICSGPTPADHGEGICELERQRNAGHTASPASPLHPESRVVRRARTQGTAPCVFPEGILFRRPPDRSRSLCPPRLRTPPHDEDRVRERELRRCWPASKRSLHWRGWVPGLSPPWRVSIYDFCICVDSDSTSLRICIIQNGPFVWKLSNATLRKRSRRPR